MKVIAYGNADYKADMERAVEEGRVCPVCGEDRPVVKCIKLDEGISSRDWYEFSKGFRRKSVYKILVWKCLTCNTMWESKPVLVRKN